MNYGNVTIRDGIKELAIFEKNLDAWVSSRTLAKMFEKDHDKILRSIQDIVDIKDDFSSANFGVSNYKTERGKTYKEYLLNRKSFALVAMGFTGDKAMQFKKAYIEAFEFMTEHITTRIMSKEGYKKMTSAISHCISNDPKVFALEADMINQIVLGMSAKKFCEVNNIDESHTRDAIVTSRLEKLDEAQRLNAQLITGGMNRDMRESLIKANFK